MGVYPDLKKTIVRVIPEFDQIPEERKEDLRKLAGCVKKQIDERGRASLMFICTHNSRRSHMCQIWAQLAAGHYGVSNAATYSGGTEATAFNSRALSSLERAGFEITQKKEGGNPVYFVKSGHDAEPMEAFSKVFSDESNPVQDFGAVMTCTQADAACPSVPGAAFRVSIPYDDPKAFDGTEQEAQKYDERSRQIAREMFYLFSQVHSL